MTADEQKKALENAVNQNGHLLFTKTFTNFKEAQDFKFSSESNSEVSIATVHAYGLDWIVTVYGESIEGAKSMTKIISTKFVNTYAQANDIASQAMHNGHQYEIRDSISGGFKVTVYKTIDENDTKQNAITEAKAKLKKAQDDAIATAAFLKQQGVNAPTISVHTPDSLGSGERSETHTSTPQSKEQAIMGKRILELD